MCVASPCDDDQPAGETHIVLLCDENIEQGLFATVNSIVANCATPEDLVFHVGLDSSRVRETEHELQALFGDKTREIEVVDVNAFPNIAQWYHRINTKLGVKRTSNLMNYARFFVAEMFPSLAADSQNTYIFLDVDKIMYGDIREHDSQLKGKYRGATKDGQFLVVGLDDSRTVFRSLGLQSWRDRVRFLIFCKKHALDHRKMCPFNAGYYVATIGLFGKDTPQKVERLISLGLLDICQFNTQVRFVFPKSKHRLLPLCDYLLCATCDVWSALLVTVASIRIQLSDCLLTQVAVPTDLFPGSETQPLMMCLLWEFTHGEKVRAVFPCNPASTCAYTATQD